MLNYHQLHGQLAENKDAHFRHFLSLGSHRAPYSVSGVRSLSEVTLLPGARLIVDEDKIPAGHLALVIPLQGRVRVDEQFYEPGTIVYQPKHIQELDHQKPEFLYLLLQGTASSHHSNQSIEPNTAITLTASLTLTQTTLKQHETITLAKYTILFIEQG